MDFTKLIENLNSQGKSMERLLTKAGRNNLANFYEKSPEVFQLIALNLIYKFSTLNIYTEKEFEAYSKAIQDFGNMMHQCLIEKQAEDKTQEEKLLS